MTKPFPPPPHMSLVLSGTSRGREVRRISAAVSYNQAELTVSMSSSLAHREEASYFYELGFWALETPRSTNALRIQSRTLVILSYFWNDVEATWGNANEKKGIIGGSLASVTSLEETCMMWTSLLLLWAWLSRCLLAELSGWSTWNLEF